jgi:hypothetical protein
MRQVAWAQQEWAFSKRSVGYLSGAGQDVGSLGFGGGRKRDVSGEAVVCASREAPA